MVYSNRAMNNVFEHLPDNRRQGYPTRTGTMLAFFQSVGALPVSREYWYSLVRIGASWLAADFKMKAETPSVPFALCILRSCRSLRTPFPCTRIESIVELWLVPFFGMFDLSSLVRVYTGKIV